MIEEQKEIFVISQLIHFERHWRDTGQWDKMRDAYHPESRVRIPWFQGNGIDFVEASKKLYHAVPSKHRLSPTLVRVHGNRALAETSTMIEARGRLSEIEVDMTTSCRLLNKVRRDDGVWRLASLDAIYEKDTIALVNPSDSLTIDSKLLQTYRPSYRFLCFALQGLGRSVDQTLAGEDRPDLVAALYADAEAWLTNSAIGTK